MRAGYGSADRSGPAHPNGSPAELLKHGQDQEFARRCGSRCRPLCEGAHVTFPARHLLCRSCRSLEDDMIAEWIAIYVVVFILCAVIVGRAPTKG